MSNALRPMMNPQTFLNWIDGRWVVGETVVENRSPSDTNDLIGLYTQATNAQVQAAIAGAAVAQPVWAATGLEKRHDVLRAVGDELIARSQELGRQLAREEGKTLAEGVGEVYRSGQFFTTSRPKSFASWAAKPIRCVQVSRSISSGKRSVL